MPFLLSLTRIELRMPTLLLIATLNNNSNCYESCVTAVTSFKVTVSQGFHNSKRRV